MRKSNGLFFILVIILCLLQYSGVLAQDAPSINLVLSDCTQITIPEGYLRSSSYWRDSSIRLGSYPYSRQGYHYVDSVDTTLCMETYRGLWDIQSVSDAISDAGYLAVEIGNSNPAGVSYVTGNKNVNGQYQAILGICLKSNCYMFHAKSTGRESMHAAFMIAFTIAEHHNKEINGTCKPATKTEVGWTGAIYCRDCYKLLSKSREIQPEEVLWLPEEVKTIKAEAFKSINTKQVVIPSGCTTIESRAFYGSRIILLVVPDSVVSIAENAFDSFYDPVIVVDSNYSEAAKWGREHYCTVYLQ